MMYMRCGHWFGGQFVVRLSFECFRQRCTKFEIIGHRLKFDELWQGF